MPSKTWVSSYVLATSAVGVILATGMAAFSAGEVEWEVMAVAAGGTGLLVYITSWCGRMYKATKHQELTNRHRALSLKTVQAFAAAAQSSEAKEAVLLGAAKCIFEGRSTGLTTEKAEIPTTTTQIIKTTRRAVRCDRRGRPACGPSGRRGLRARSAAPGKNGDTASRSDSRSRPRRRRRPRFRQTESPSGCASGRRPHQRSPHASPSRSDSPGRTIENATGAVSSRKPSPSLATRT